MPILAAAYRSVDYEAAHPAKQTAGAPVILNQPLPSNIRSFSVRQKTAFGLTLMTKRFGFDGRPRMRLLCGGAIAIVLGFVTIAGYTIVDSWNATWKNAVQSSENLAAALAHDIDRNIALYDLSLQTVVAGLKLPELPQLSPALRNAVLFDGSASADDFGAIFVLDERGNVSLASRASTAETLNFAEREFFTAHRDNPQLGLYISAPFRLRVTGQWAIGFSRRIDRPDGSFAGVVYGSVKLEYFRRLFERVDLGPDGTLTLMRTDGVVLFRKPYINPEVHRIVPDFAHFRSAPSGSFEATGQIDGIKRLFVYRQIGDLPLVTAVGPTTKVILSEWERKAAITLALMLALVTVAAWLLYRLLSEFVRRAEAERRALQSEQRHKLMAEAEREARAALERSVAQVESSAREQRRAQLALRESERRFRDFAESCGDWFWETGMDHRFTLYVANSHNADDRGHGNPIGKTAWEIAGCDPQTDPLWRAHREDLDAHRPFRRFRFSVPAADGKWIHISTSGIPVFDEQGEFSGYRGTTFEITAAVEARRRTQQAEMLLRNAVDSISEGFVIYDADDRFVMCNAAHERLYSIVASHLRPGVPFEDMVRAGVMRSAADRGIADPEAWIAQRLRDHRNPPALAVERQLWDGRWVLVCERRMSDGGTASLQIDITALKETQQALRESEQRLARAQRIAGVGDVEHELSARRVTWSDHAYEIYGVPWGRVPSWEEFLALIHPEDRDATVRLAEQVWAGEPPPGNEYRIIRPDGQVRHLLRENESIRDLSGRVVRVASTVQDITELRQSQERERDLQAQLQHRQKLEALGTLAGGIAHDMNNTLVPILALSKRAMAQAPSGTRERRNFETIFHASEHARDLVKQILTFSRKDSADKKPVRLGAITRDALQIVRAGLPAMIALVERIDDTPLVLGDAGQIRQVVINLVTNAAQAIGDTIGVITVRVEASRDGARLGVTDTGCGIDDQHLPRLFDPFFTTKEAGHGTGLGLSVVHGIVTAHGGRIEVETALGRGAEFTVVLPAIAVQQSPVSIDPAA
jgi:PAS domain S-box-containing protein